MRIFTPKNNKWIAGISAILVGAASITTPVNLQAMIPEFMKTPLLGGISIMGIAAYGAVIGGALVLMRRTE